MMSSTPTLARRFDPRRNSLSILRLLLATVVAVVHAEAIGWGRHLELGRTLVGDLAVDAFFVISGFLVTRSVVRLPSLRRFAWHRALRIMPGFWVCLLATAFVVAPLIAWLQGRSPGTVFAGDNSAFGYATRNSALLTRQWGIATGLGHGDTDAIDGSLWTLFYEALCYAAVGALAAVGVVKRWRGGVRRSRHRATLAERHRGSVTGFAARVVRYHLLLVIAVAVWFADCLSAAGLVSAGIGFLSRFLLMFLCGALAHVYAHRVRFPPAMITACAVVVAVAVTAVPDYRPLGAVPFAYLCLWAVVALPLRWEPPWDLSYGTYVYHWPIELVLAEIGLRDAGRPVFVVTALALTGLVAFASWRFVEAPAMRQRNAAWVDGLRRTPSTQPAVRQPVERERVPV